MLTDEITGENLKGNGRDAIKIVSQNLTGEAEENRVRQPL
jgi:hypothetical protein